MSMDEYSGRVKYYSKEKGYGFIGSNNPLLLYDVWFHVASIRGEDVPCVGDKVVFLTDIEKVTRERYNATKVTIVEETENKRKPVLAGFPMIRGNRITNFSVKKDLGHVSTDCSYQGAAITELQAQANLRSLVEGLGGNAVFFYKMRSVDNLGVIASLFNNKTRYICEGNAVFIEAT